MDTAGAPQQPRGGEGAGAAAPARPPAAEGAAPRRALGRGLRAPTGRAGGGAPRRQRGKAEE